MYVCELAMEKSGTWIDAMKVVLYTHDPYEFTVVLAHLGKHAHAMTLAIFSKEECAQT